MSDTYIEEYLNIDTSGKFRRRKRIFQRKMSDPTPIFSEKKSSLKHVLGNVGTLTRNMAGKCIRKIHHAHTLSKDVAELCINSGYQLLSHAELPDWLKDNEFLQNFHRPHLPSVKGCLRSILSIHTETGNIWTHLVGQVMFVLAAINFYFACPGYYPTYIPKIFRGFLFWLPSFWSLPFSDKKILNPLIQLDYLVLSDVDQCRYIGMAFADHIVIGSFFIGATSCLLFSWLFHTFYCHSPRAAMIFARMDYAGICSLITTSSYPHIYYAFRKQRHLQIIYMSCVTLCGTMCIIFTSIEKFATVHFRTHRAALFTVFGLINIIPYSHVLSRFGWNFVYYIFGGKYVFLSAIFYLSGVVIYANRIPERIFPNYFNIWFQSHQIHHICVVAGLFASFKSIFILVHVDSYLIKTLENTPSIIF